MAVVRFVNGHSQSPFAFFATQAKPGSQATEAKVNFPAVNILESADAYLLEVGAPGFEKEDFQLSLDGSILIIASLGRSKKQSVDLTYHQQEFGNDAFERRFTLPQTVDTDQIQARCQHGVLQLHMPKKAEWQQKQIRVVDVQ